MNNHTHDGCTCGCNHSHEPLLTAKESDFLSLLETNKVLPVVQYVMKSTVESTFECIALPPVYLTNKDNSLEEVKERGEMIQKLYDMELIEIDFSTPVSSFSYDDYEQADVYTLLKNTIADAVGKPGFLVDHAVMLKGSMYCI